MVEVKVPNLAESITEGTISNWVVKEGDHVQEGDVLLELETDKVNMEVPAVQAGVVKQILKQTGETVEVGEVVAHIAEGSGASEPPKAQEKVEETPAKTPPAQEATKTEQPKEVESQRSASGKVKASPSVRKLAREQGIDLEQIQTKDPAGRIGVEDVQAHKQTATKAESKPQSIESEQAVNPAKPVERVKMTRRRQTIATHLLEAQHSAAMLTTFNEVDMTAVMAVRKRRKDAFREAHDVNLGFMSFFTKAVVGALKTFPMINAEIDGQDILYKKYYDIGIAVATENGLVVPVVRDADRLTFVDIERDIAGLAGKARSNKLTLEDLRGGTFTITNGGVYGSLFSTPILNTPQVGILGMHSIQTRPVTVDGDKMENRPMMYIALSYDHRIVDGKEAVQFLVMIKKLLEDPELLLLEG
jgi:2-oxoglutarate dehydrogenase E2 component (dihydrolipoamide succinyltransferase)